MMTKLVSDSRLCQPGCMHSSWSSDAVLSVFWLSVPCSGLSGAGGIRPATLAARFLAPAPSATPSAAPAAIIAAASTAAAALGFLPHGVDRRNRLLAGGGHHERLAALNG